MPTRREMIKGAAMAASCVAFVTPATAQCQNQRKGYVRLIFTGLWAFHISDTGVVAFTPAPASLGHSVVVRQWDKNKCRKTDLGTLADSKYVVTGFTPSPTGATNTFLAGIDFGI